MAADEVGLVLRARRRSTASRNASAARGRSQLPTKVSAVPARVASRSGCQAAIRGLDARAGIICLSITCPSTISSVPAGTSSDDSICRTAPVGHASRHARHSVHSTWSMVATPSRSSRPIAPVGQVSKHTAHPVHVTRSMYNKSFTSSLPWKSGEGSSLRFPDATRTSARPAQSFSNFSRRPMTSANSRRRVSAVWRKVSSSSWREAGSIGGGAGAA